MTDKLRFDDLENVSDWDDDVPAPAEHTLAIAESIVEQTTRAISGGAVASQTTGKYKEKCPKCRDGVFYSYTGRAVGNCFKCKGTGTLIYKSSPESRRKSRDGARNRRIINASDKRRQGQEWLDANPVHDAFLKQSWGFPVDLREKLYKYGFLTPGQLAAVDKCIAKQAVKAAARGASQSDIDLSEIRAGFYAVPNGDTRLKVRINKPTRGRWVDWIFVDDGAEYGQRQKYGTQRPGERYAGKIENELRAIVADPFEASKAYGRLVGACGVCGRKLETEQSVAAGIGPVCAAKLGGG